MFQLKYIVTLIVSITITSQIINAKLVDLTYNLEENMIRWPAHTNFKFTKQFIYDKTLYVAYNEFQTSEHIGTHMDAFSHFAKNGTSIDLMSVKNFFLNGILIDVSDKCKNNPNYTVSEEDLNFTKKELDFMKRSNCILFIRTGYGKYWGNKEKYFGTNDDDVSKIRFPSIGESGARKIIQLKKFLVVGIDVVSTDPGYSRDYITHRLFAENGVYGLENVANLDQLPEHEFFHVYLFPMKIKGGTGAPTRIVAKLLREHYNGKVPKI